MKHDDNLYMIHPAPFWGILRCKCSEHAVTRTAVIKKQNPTFHFVEITAAITKRIYFHGS